MPRLRQVHRHQTSDPVVLYMYDRKYGDRDPVAEPGTATGTPGNWEPVFALVPDVFEHAIRGFMLYQSPDRVLPPQLRELAQTRVGFACGSQFVFSQHCKELRKTGVPEEKVSALPHWSVSEVFTAAERAVLGYTDCLALEHGRVPDGLFAELERHLTHEQILELTYITAMYAMNATMTRALRLEFDDRDETVHEVPAPEGYVPRPTVPIELPPR